MALISRRNFLNTGILAGFTPFWSKDKFISRAGTDAWSSYIGKSKWDLDSPALCVDLDKMERNIQVSHERLRGSGIGIRPHVKTHKCPDIAKRQMEAGAIGICVAKLSEAEVMLREGISEVLMTGVNISPAKIKRAMALRKKHSGFIQAVDNPQNALDLQEAAKAEGIIADVVVDINVVRRSGILPGEPALQLAQLVDKQPNLRFKGILAYDGGVQHVKGFVKRKQDAIRRMEPAVTSYELMKKSGLNLEIFSGGGTGTYNIMNEIPGFTDVQIGSYLFMDHQYMVIGSETNETLYDDFIPSLTVITTIINKSYENRLVTDAGTKALTLNQPPAIVLGEPGFKYSAGSDEYGTITYEDAVNNYQVGDKLEVIVPHCDPVINLYDVIFGIRSEKVTAVIPVLARGKSQ